MSIFSAPKILLPFGVFTAINPMAVFSAPYAVSAHKTKTYIIMHWSQSWFVAAPNNAANFWTIYLQKQTGAVIIATFSTAGLGAGIWVINGVDAFIPNFFAPSDLLMYVVCAPTGAPGNLYASGPIVEVV